MTKQKATQPKDSDGQPPDLRARMAVGARILHKWSGHRLLQIPATSGDRYCVVQLDDYAALPRRRFPWHPPVKLQLRARVSAPDLPGTWGFGWWNDPFSTQLGLGGAARRLPAMPNAAWFFHASPPNHLALCDDHPVRGFLAATFAAPRVPWPLLALGMPALPLLAWPLTARVLRRAARLFVREDARTLDVDAVEWHDYELAWHPKQVRFSVDGEVRFATPVVPNSPLGLVIWIDNQFMAFPPDGRLRFGHLANPEAQLEVDQISLLETK